MIETILLYKYNNNYMTKFKKSINCITFTCIFIDVTVKNLNLRLIKLTLSIK